MSSSVRKGLHVKYPLALSCFNQTLSRQIFEKSSNVKLYKTSPLWRPTCSKRTDRQTGMTKLTFVFRNFANEPNYK